MAGFNKGMIPSKIRRPLKGLLSQAQDSTQRLREMIAPTAAADFEALPLPSGRGKPRILVIMQSYPNFSETYMHEEIRNLREDFDIKIVTLEKSDRARLHPWEHQLIEYRAPNLAYARIEKLNLEFDLPKQQEFLRQIGTVIREFKPHALHCHFLGLGLLLRRLAEDHHIPFTVRTHSSDLLYESDEKLSACCEALNSSWCRRVLVFPEFRARLIEHGLDPDKAISCWPVINFPAFFRPEQKPATGRVICSAPAIEKKAHNDFVDLAVMMRDRSDLEFDLYAKGRMLDATRAYNARHGNVVNISYADPEDMPDVYPRYDWMVYPAKRERGKVGLPVGIAEAQAAGIGVCWQELPGRRQEQLDFLGGGGFLYKSLDELPDILLQPYPEEMRHAGFEAAKRCDIRQHRHLLSEVWESAAAFEPATKS